MKNLSYKQTGQSFTEMHMKLFHLMLHNHVEIRFFSPVLLMQNMLEIQ
jgi:hypothetical protein